MPFQASVPRWPNEPTEFPTDRSRIGPRSPQGGEGGVRPVEGGPSSVTGREPQKFLPKGGTLS